MTLSFIGDLDLDEVRPLCEQLRLALGEGVGDRTMRASLGPPALRGDRAVLWLPASGLASLAGVVDAAVQPFSTRKPSEAFFGHLTLARARRGHRLATSLAGGGFEAGWTVREVNLVRSHLGSAGARYEVIGEVAIGE